LGYFHSGSGLSALLPPFGLFCCPRLWTPGTLSLWFRSPYVLLSILHLAFCLDLFRFLVDPQSTNQDKTFSFSFVIDCYSFRLTITCFPRRTTRLKKLGLAHPIPFSVSVGEVLRQMFRPGSPEPSIFPTHPKVSGLLSASLLSYRHLCSPAFPFDPFVSALLCFVGPPCSGRFVPPPVILWTPPRLTRFFRGNKPRSPPHTIVFLSFARSPSSGRFRGRQAL